jgi:methyl-accepting chemotaxis protein
VVASEVRRLSQQSARAARDLTQLAANADQTLGGVTLMLNFEVQEPDGLRLGHP